MNALVMDVEGTDGRERGEDQDFERKSALFSLATAEVLLVNMWEHQVGLYQGGTRSFAGQHVTRTHADDAIFFLRCLNSQHGSLANSTRSQSWSFSSCKGKITQCSQRQSPSAVRHPRSCRCDTPCEPCRNPQTGPESDLGQPDQGEHLANVCSHEHESTSNISPVSPKVLRTARSQISSTWTLRLCLTSSFSQRTLRMRSPT